jgi:hypothetical protein
MSTEVEENSGSNVLAKGTVVKVGGLPYELLADTATNPNAPQPIDSRSFMTATFSVRLLGLLLRMFRRCWRTQGFAYNVLE